MAGKQVIKNRQVIAINATQLTTESNYLLEQIILQCAKDCDSLEMI